MKEELVRPHHHEATGDDAVMAAAGMAASEWRGRANDPLTGVTEAEVFEAAARTAEVMYAAAHARATP